MMTWRETREFAANLTAVHVKHRGNRYPSPQGPGVIYVQQNHEQAAGPGHANLTNALKRPCGGVVTCMQKSRCAGCCRGALNNRRVTGVSRDPGNPGEKFRLIKAGT